VVRQYWVANADVACDAFVEATRGKDAIGGCEVLFTVEAFVLGSLKGWVFADFERLARLGTAHCCYSPVVIAFSVIYSRACRDGSLQVPRRCCERATRG
jgi:hypothetical protein